ncbi:MAG: hypothetical protein A2Z57_11180 [Planctomycetes bacterium RIFCSPHIGHO2_12_39_6]|nr:MAG: hypothetical protein A2Z57_11180 [Planctomycetes bacterium RIFCSPHIGHO2_12_39_6]
MEKPESQREILRDIQFSQTRILNILLGDEQAKQEGLVHKVHRHTDYIRQDKKFKWGVATLLFGSTGGFMAWIKQNLGI